MKLEEISFEVKKSKEQGFCNNQIGYVNYCSSYKEKGCPETCEYAEKRK